MPNITFTGQGVAKDCIVGDRLMDRYGIFNGLERPRRIDSNLQTTILGFDSPTITSVVGDATAGNLVATNYYAYVAVYASTKYTRPVAVQDGSLNMTRGNYDPTNIVSALCNGTALKVTISGSPDAGVTHILIYRSIQETTSAAAINGPFYFIAAVAITPPSTSFIDTIADTAKGQAVEMDNDLPPTARYAIATESYLFAGGNFLIGPGFTCTVTPGSGTVTINGPTLYDGILGWYFKCTSDAAGGVNGAGLYYANYVNPTTLQLIDASNTNTTYNGSLSGAGQTFALYPAGNVLQWSKYGEPESWPLANLIEFEGDITGIAEMPNLPYLIVCTDSPSVWMFDLTLLGTSYFTTNRRKISSTFTATSHYGLCGVDSNLRGIDAKMRCLWETDGVHVQDITRSVMPDIWQWLKQDEAVIKNWHAVYDQAQKIYGAFVTFNNAQRLVDFCIGQNTITGGWFFNFEKDLLCTGYYDDPVTGESMVLGGMQGLPSGGGSCWGRIWCPGVYNEWIPAGSLQSGTILSATPTVITVDNSVNSLYTGPGALIGRWVLVADANDENAQMAYIQSNTANSMVVDTVVNSPNPVAFSPVPVAGWKFYTGLIEMRWGPKRFDFSDPDIDKNILEVLFVVNGHDTGAPPFIRVYRGFDTNYTFQRKLQQASYKDKTYNQALYHRHESLIEPTPRWGVEFLDRSYQPTTLRNMSLVHTMVGDPVRGKK
jgi:hypothetical protein